MLNYNNLPLHMQPSISRYIEHGITPGSFLLAVLENKLVESFAHADEDNRASMFFWAEWLYNEAPAAAWGSPEKVKAWTEARREERE